MQTDSTARHGTLRQIPRGIWMLCFLSLFMDLSSEVIHILATLVASVVAVELWGRFGASAIFYAGAGFCITTLTALTSSTTTLRGKA